MCMLKDKNIVITGSNGGIGSAVVRACAANGANVFVCMRQRSAEYEENLRQLAETYHVDVYPIYFDLSDESAVKEGASQILKYKLPITGIVNNAGTVGEKKLFLMTSMADIRKTFDVNFFGSVYLTQRLLKNMIKNKTGSIVNVSSAAALDGEPAQFEYVSSKAALLGATKKWANELGVYGIRVNAVAPGVTETRMVAQMKPELREKTIGNTALGRMGQPDEIARTIVFLLSDQSGYMTGQTLRIDGGLHS